MGDWSIFVEMNVMYLCTQKHKYIPKKLFLVFMKVEGILNHVIHII
jgi:hypothetical protein